MKKIDILYDALLHLDRQTILNRANENDEKPFGYVIDYLKDNYNLNKMDGWHLALSILAFFEICNE